MHAVSAKDLEVPFLLLCRCYFQVIAGSSISVGVDTGILSMTMPLSLSLGLSDYKYLQTGSSLENAGRLGIVGKWRHVA